MPIHCIGTYNSIALAHSVDDFVLDNAKISLSRKG